LGSHGFNVRQYGLTRESVGLAFLASFAIWWMAAVGVLLALG
jgi:hypothetical protein